MSFFEADAFARWAGVRLPTESEWEFACDSVDAANGSFVELKAFHPTVAAGEAGLQQMFGEVWQWTASAYLAYPGYRPPPGALGEYNGKFMCNQFVLRGGSIATSRTPHPPDVPKLFSARRTLAVQRFSTGEGCMSSNTLDHSNVHVVPAPIELLDFEPAADDVRAQVKAGLGQTHKSLPANFFMMSGDLRFSTPSASFPNIIPREPSSRSCANSARRWPPP